MKILRVAQVLANRSGGMSRTMFLTGDELQRRGHTVDYWFEGDLAVKGPAELWRFITPFKVRGKLRQAIKAGTNWDIVEIHEPLGAALTLSRIPNGPRVVAFSYGLEERARLANMDYRRRHGLPVSLKSRFSPLTVVWQAMRTVRHADHILCSNPTDIAHLVAAGVSPDRLTRHFSGVESEFLAAEPPPPETRSGILFFGTWIDRKGVRDLVPAVVALLRARPGLRFTAAGTTLPEDHVLSAFAPDVRGRVRVIPKVDGSDALIRLYAEHAIFVLPSFFEGHPLVLVEAASQGLPLVGADIGGVRDFIDEGQGGFVVPVAAPDRLQGALETLLDNPGLRAKFGDANRRKAARFTWAAAAENIEQAYRKALSMPPR